MPGGLSSSQCVVVTGAAGLLGQHVMRALESLNTKRLVGVVRESSRFFGNKGMCGEYRVADLADPAQIDDLRELSADIIVHTAARLPASLDDKVAAATNRALDLNILDLARKCRARLIYVSSTAVYGNSKTPWNENSVSSELPAYAAEKLRTEALVRSLDLPSVVLRISSPYSAIGVDRPGVLFHFVRQAIADSEVRVRGNGTRAQDFVHAQDVAGAVSAICGLWHDGQLQDAWSPIFNIASGFPITMLELAERIVGICGSGRITLEGKPTAEDEYRAVVDISRARRSLGWAPLVSLDEGIAQMVRRLRGEDEDWLSF